MSNLSLGRHRIELSATDLDGQTTSDVRYVNIIDPGDAHMINLTDTADIIVRGTT